jgi:hypothetical protein
MMDWNEKKQEGSDSGVFYFTLIIPEFGLKTKTLG